MSDTKKSGTETPANSMSGELASRIFYAIREPHLSVWQTLLPDLAEYLLPVDPTCRSVIFRADGAMRTCKLRNNSPGWEQAFHAAMSYLVQHNNADLVMTLDVVKHPASGADSVRVFAETRFDHVALVLSLDPRDPGQFDPESLKFVEGLESTHLLLANPVEQLKDEGRWKELATAMLECGFQNTLRKVSSSAGIVLPIPPQKM